MARASSPLLGVRTPTEGVRRGRSRPLMSQAPPAGDGKGDALARAAAAFERLEILVDEDDFLSTNDGRDEDERDLSL